MGHLLLFYMHGLRMEEIARCNHIFPNMYMSYALPLYEHHIKLGNLDSFALGRVYYWDDATKMGNYFDYVMRRINKYGLHWGLLNKNKFQGYKEKIAQEEDDLTKYFLYEMRKAPVEQNELNKMPI